MNIQIEGLEEAERDISRVLKKMPETSKIELKYIANDLRKNARKNSPDSGQEHKSKLKKKWYVKMIDSGLNLTAMVGNSAPHMHLIEKGHEMIVRGQNIGFYEGKHFFEKTCNEYEKVYPEKLEAAIDRLLKEV